MSKIPVANEKLMNSYEKLSEYDKLLLLLYSVLYSDIKQTKVIECLNSPIFRSFGYGAVYGKAFKPHLDALRDASLVALTEGNTYQCNPEIAEVIIRYPLDDVKLKRIFQIVEVVTEKRYGLSYNEMFRFARIALYRGDDDLYAAIEKIQGEHYHDFRKSYPPVLQVLSVLLSPFDQEFIKKFHFKENHFEILFSNILTRSFDISEPNIETIEFLAADCNSEKPQSNALLISSVCGHLLLQGRFADSEKIEKLHLKNTDEFILSAKGTLDFIQGRIEDSLASFNSAANAGKKKANRRNYTFSSFISILYFFSLLHNTVGDNYARALEYSKKIAGDLKHPFNESFRFFYDLTRYITGIETGLENLFNKRPAAAGLNYWTVLSYAFSIIWARPAKAKRCLPDLKTTLHSAAKSGYKWIEMQLHDLIYHIEKNEINRSRALELRKELNGFFLTDLIQRKEEWKIAINALTSLATPAITDSAIIEKIKRLAWLIDFETISNYCRIIQPVEQSYQPKKGWSNGRNVSLKRLRTEFSKIPYLTEQDIRAISHIKVEYYGFYGETVYNIDESAIMELAGHPFLFWIKTNTRFEIERSEPELRVSEVDDKTLKLTFYPEITNEENKFKLELETPSKLKLTVFSPHHLKISRIIGKSGLSVPKEAEEEVVKAITSLSGSINIQSDIEGDGSHAELVEALPKPYILLLPFQSGLKIAAFCRPFAGNGPYYKPGKGAKNLITQISGKKFQTKRDIFEEEKQISDLLNSCPTLQSSNDESEFEWILDEPDTCLQILVELQDAADKVVIEWPEGEKFRVSSRAQTSKFHMNIKRDNDWFSVSGELELENGQVMEMQKLMELLDQTPGRFLRMSDGSFMALTDKFRKQLDELRAYSESSKSGLRFSPLIAPLIDDMTSQAASLKADKAWSDHLQKLDALKEFKPELPNTFQANLRDYQLLGFEWLSRLSHWGVGACLADDMGLGKTIQALSILLTRAPSGPSLVIAPTSVCMNWHTEVSKFAPTMTSIQFTGKKRDSLVNELKPFDLLICSYGMIQQEEVAETLKNVSWQIVILDEAQAIKNMSTKRSQAVMNLQAGFKLITTGTPIENHLGELWNLFRFLNPGLLGSLEKFNQRFAIPIEKNKDKAARHSLKKLLQPFILRRMKNEVLDELPEKTEITLHVELSEKEKAFYEALRLNALKKINDALLPAGHKHLQILAEIMKLRRACCNPRLVTKEIEIPSSKLSAFIEILDELLDNKHKALVFSQFVDHLSILKEYLEEKNIPYQYLDGSTPMKDRKTRVDAFQSGEGEIFLISLKAGGTGLNLTAADYVIHMDPWWNPAVEDQASDRAHRIGQQRPVTIYRLVAKDTIEEKIIDLHKHKRDLANSLLEETDMIGKVSADELLNLLKGNQ